MKGSLEYIINKNLKNWRNPIFLSWKIIKKCVLHGKTREFPQQKDIRNNP